MSKTSEEEWLRSEIPELTGPTVWNGVKILGSGAYGRVGLWESIGPDNTPNYIAIKEPITFNLEFQGNYDVASTHENDEDDDDEMVKLDYEGQIQLMLCQTKSQHILALAKDPVRVPKKNGSYRVARLLMEYCPLGTLGGLLDQRKKRQRQFAESTLWQFFDCLVDGLCVLAFGQEATFDAQSQTWTASKIYDDWYPICHMDLHSENAILSKFNESHPLTPVAKICDFGLSEQDGVHEGIPGQDSDKGDATTSNIWQVGEIMYRLCRLDNMNDIEKDISSPNGVKDWQLKGTICGLGLMQTPYSGVLKRTILECLYEDPDLRSELLDLKNKVQMGLRAANVAQPGGEPWERFFAPEPESNIPGDMAALEPGEPTNIVTPTTKKELEQLQEDVRAAERQAREEAAEDDALPRKKPPPSQIQYPPPTGGSMFG